jgi:RHS repeat-associated protein
MSTADKIGNETMKLLRNLVWLAAMLTGLAAQAGAVTYYHNDIAGSPVVATDAAGQVIWRESYRPYGERLTNALASVDNKVWFTSRRQDVETGLVYMGARYYDPVMGRFISRDPVEFDGANIHSHNRYAYANNNPYRYVDPTGAAGESIVLRGLAIAGGVVGLGGLVQSPQERERSVRAAQEAWRGLFGLNVFNESESNESKKPESGKTNPYKGPVDQPVIVVDPKGNAIPVDKGERVNSSPNGDYQQVVGSDGRPTGVRMDRGGHKNHKDPNAQVPHGHRPGVQTPDGNPHLPIQ